MCVAAVIFNKVSLEYLQAMEAQNPDGAGVAFAREGKIAFIKGLTAAQIFQFQEDDVMSYPYLLHFRFATHGDSVPELTHPFPIGPRALFGELTGTCESVLIHNGTWNTYEMAIPNQDVYPKEFLDEMSDTAIAAWLAEDDPSILDMVPWATAVGFIGLDGAMDITTRGSFSDEGGNWYSNLIWKPYRYANFHNHYSQYATTGRDTLTKSDRDWADAWAVKYRTSGAVDSAQKDIEESPEIKELSFEEYCRRKYGDEVANSVYADSYDELDFPEDVVSEDFDTVNSIIAKYMLGA